MNLVKELPEAETVKRVNEEAISATLVQETNDFQEYLLPYGWKKVGYRRKSGSSQNVWDFYAISPDGKRLRSSNEVNKYLDNNPGVKCDMNVTNTKRPTKLSENRKSDAKMAKYSTSHPNHSNLTFETETEPQPVNINSENNAAELVSENQENSQSSKYQENVEVENSESMIHGSNDKVEDWEAFIQEHYGENSKENQPESNEDIDMREVTQIDHESKDLSLSKHALVKDVSKNRMKSTAKMNSKGFKKIKKIKKK